MKHSDNTEMDRLLRRYARSNSETLPSGEGSARDANTGSVTHMDADEMNAYAENALPEATRSRYFAHLADCDTCRRLVTDLTLAASVSLEGKERIAAIEATPSKSWREWLSEIFSPPVLRYGVPALALFAIVIVALVATRTQRQDSSVAQNTQTKYSAPSISGSSNSVAETGESNTTAESHSNSNVAPVQAPQGPLRGQEGQQPPDASATPQNKSEASETDAPIIAQDQVAATPAERAGVLKDSTRQNEVAGKRSEEEPAAPPAPTPADLAITADGSGRDKREEQKKAKTARADDDESAAGGRTVGGAIAKQSTAKEDRGSVETNTAARRARSVPAAKSAPPSGAASESVGEKERFAETRSAGGRRFQREGSAWVDTAYQPSRPTTNIKRGSEQYRALMADEPGLRSIVEQFNGEVIVVWKSRAYRFH